MILVVIDDGERVKYVAGTRMKSRECLFEACFVYHRLAMLRALPSV